MDIQPLIEKMLSRKSHVENELAEVAATNNISKMTELSKEHSRIVQLETSWNRLQDCHSQIADNKEMLQNEDDADFCAEIQADVDKLTAEIDPLELSLRMLVLPPEENDSRNTIVEIRPAAGGDEAALFADELYRMYSVYAGNNGWKEEVLEHNESDIGGLKNVQFCLQGDDVYRFMQYESGVHRVQRIPTTETSGRIHTSTVTVAVLPEATELELDIKTEDLDIKVTRASGPGGQSVNTTDSAVVITHIPSCITVQCQNEKSQHKNKAQAMRVLRSRLLEKKQKEEHEKYAAERKSQIGTGDRSERIRTYNFPQNRITDHRFNLSWFNLPGMLEGNIQTMLDDILTETSRQRLEEEIENIAAD